MLNEQQQEAVNLALSGHNIYLCGRAGTGKSYTIKELHKHLTDRGKVVAITCKTGIACSNFDNACTLHRWSGIHDGRYRSDEIIKLNSLNEAALYRIRTTDVLIVDEISMLSQRLFDQLVAVVTALRRDNDEFLCGLQLIVCGDFNQLAPVPNRRFSDNGDFCFLSPNFRKLHKINLTEVVRQTDPVLIRSIEKVSEGGKIDEETITYMKNLTRPLKGQEETTKLFATNDLVNSYNRTRIERQPGALMEYVSNDCGDGKYLNELTAPKRLWLKEKCPVVLIRNLSDKLYNGLQGFVTGFDAKGPMVYFPALKSTSKIGKVTFSVFSPQANRVLASREQVPLLLSYALTVHKAQGMTLDRVEIDCQQIFKAGQLGVAMARVRSVDGLRVINFTPKVCLPQPEEISEYLSTPMVETAEDFSCCKGELRPSDEALDTVLFGEEIEQDVPGTEEDLEDEFNDVIASLKFTDTDRQQQLPDGFELVKILQECITAMPVTGLQEEVNACVDDLLENSIQECKVFVSTQLEEISNVINALQATPGTQVKADKLTEVYAEIHKYQLSDSYKVSCLLQFAKYPTFLGVHSFICTRLTDGVRKFLMQEKSKPYEEIGKEVPDRSITDESRARIRYVAGYCVSKLHKQYSTSHRTNMFSASSVGQRNYVEAKEKLKVLNSLKEEEQYLRMFSTDKGSLSDIDRRQYMTRGLVNVSDDMFEFSVQLCQESLELLVDKNFIVHGQDMYQYCLGMLLKSDQLLNGFVSVASRNLLKQDFDSFFDSSDELVVKDVLESTVRAVNSIQSVYTDLLGKFLMVMLNQFRKDLLHCSSVTKTMAHRKQIQVRQQKKKNAEKSVSFKTIQDDKTERKDMSHSLLRGLILSNVDVFQQMKKKEIETVGRAYGLTGMQNTKKSDLIGIVQRSIKESSHMSHYQVFDPALSTSTKKGPTVSTADSQPSTSIPQPSTSDPQPSTSDPRPSTSDPQLSTSDPRPSTSDPRPSTSDLQPSTSVLLSQEDDSSSDEDVCGHCHKVGKEGVQWIQCSVCLLWYHRNCAGLRLNRDWGRYKGENVRFLCKQCR